MTKVKIYDLNKQIIAEGTLKQKVEKALEKGQGALYTTIDEGEYILMQTKQKCYHCDKLMFELTPTTFSYMDPESRCPICNGTGKIVEIDEKRLIEHPELSLLDGAASFWGKLKSFKLAPNANWMKGQVFGLAEQMQVDLEKPWCALPEAFKEKLLHGTKEEVTFSYHNKKNGRKGEISRPVEGMIELIKRLHDENEESNRLQKYMKEISCTYCEGERLNKEGRMVTVGDLRYPEVGAMSFDELLKFCIQLPTLLGENQYKKVETFVIQLKELAQAAEYLGIGYLEMNRETSTLSGGEGQRLKLLSAMQNHMKGLLYLFDEPSKGLHPKDYHKVAQMMRTLKEEGNTIIMVEHNEDMIRMADYIIEIGLEAGEAGGYLVGEGTMDEMLEHTNTQLSHYLGKNKGNQVNSSRNHAVEFIKMQDLNHNNLKNIAIQFPKKALTCICGVSGSGKSSLMKGAIYERCKEDHTFSDVCLVDQLPIGRTSRSVVATYIGVMDAIRAEMALTPGAVERAYDEKMFSFNGEMGQCQECKGEGRIKLKYIEDADILCPDCKGRRYKKEVLEITYQDKNIADILQMSVKEAIEFWRDKEHIAYALQVVDEVGMGYLRMGQSTTTLSGGEASRLKLAKQLMGRAHKNVLYLLDEPTTGLHFSDVEHILKLINKLIQEGNTVIAIEHNKQFISKCDWFIELGPGAGREGGRVIYQGNK